MYYIYITYDLLERVYFSSSDTARGFKNSDNVHSSNATDSFFNGSNCSDSFFGRASLFPTFLYGSIFSDSFGK